MTMARLNIRILVAGMCLLSHAHAFTIPQTAGNLRVTTVQTYRAAPSVTALHVIADAPIEKEGEKQRSSDDGDTYDAWIPSKGGGFIPNLKSRFRRSHRQAAATTITSPITEVTDIHAYKKVVVQEETRMVCVRFYAPWCRACKAVEGNFRRLSDEYPGVKFVEVPLSKDNAYLHKGLGVPSLPFAHIYHPAVGLVEERKINKTVFGEFKHVLQTYVHKECPVDYDESGAFNY